MKVGTRVHNVISDTRGTVTHVEKDGTLIVQRTDGSKAAYSAAQAKALLRKP